MDINLLPEKEKRDVTWLIITAAILVLFSFVYATFRSLEAGAEDKVGELEQKQRQLTSQFQEEETMRESGAQGELEDLRDAVEEIEAAVVPASSLLQTVTELLPEGGYIIGFDYTYPSTFQLTVQLETANEAADLQHALQENDVFSDVSAESLNHSDPLDEESESFMEAERVPRYEAVYEMTIAGGQLRQTGDRDDS